MTKHIIETPYRTIETHYSEDEDIYTSFDFHPSTTKPLILAEIGEIIIIIILMIIPTAFLKTST